MKSLDRISLLKNFTISQIGHLQNCLEDIFEGFMLKFINKMHLIQLQYKIQKKNRILVLTIIFQKNADIAVMKSAMYVVEVFGKR